jgi:cytochrome c-type biogenesis protein CcmH
MEKKLIALFAVPLLGSVAVVAVDAQSAPVSLTSKQIALIRKIEGRVMAPCCYTQTIRDHDSQVAVEMRAEVTALVASGKSEQEIITYYRTKYGETILVVPDGLQGRLLTGFPIAAFLASILLLLLYIRRAVRATDATASLMVSNASDVDRAAFQKKIRADLGEVR